MTEVTAERRTTVEIGDKAVAVGGETAREGTNTGA